MPDNTQDGGLAAVPAATPTEAMPVSDNVSADQYAAAQAKKMLERMAKANPPAEAEPEAVAEDTEPVAESESGSEEKAPDQPTDEKEQPKEGEEQADTDDDDVLSQYEPKTQEKLKKRIGKEVEKRRLAEEKAAAEAAERAKLQAEVERLKAEQSQPAPEVEPVVVPVDDPNDLTAKASSEADLAKVEQEAKATLDFIEDNEALINRAIARDEETVKLSDGTEYNVQAVLKAKRLAKQQVEKYVPARKGYLQVRTQAIAAAQQKFPALFKRDTQEYQTLQQTIRQYPALRQVPNLELMFGYALHGLQAEAAMAKQAEAAKAVKPASATPAKTGADTAPAVAPVRPKASSPRKAVEEQLARAEKSFEKDGSDSAYQQVQLLRAKLKQLK